MAKSNLFCLEKGNHINCFKFTGSFKYKSSASVYLQVVFCLQSSDKETRCGQVGQRSVKWMEEEKEVRIKKHIGRGSTANKLAC